MQPQRRLAHAAEPARPGRDPARLPARLHTRTPAGRAPLARAR